MAVSGDSVGTMIEVCPADIALQPGSGDDEPAVGSCQRTGSGMVPFHFLLSVSSDLGTIQRIGAREGWVTQLAGRGAPGQEPFFNVVEFWIENTLMLELAPEDMMDTYTDRFQLPMRDAPRALLKEFSLAPPWPRQRLLWVGAAAGRLGAAPSSLISR